MSNRIECLKWFATFLEYTSVKMVMVLAGLLTIIGCQSGLYQISTSEDEKKELDVKFQYYDAADASKPMLEANQVCHPEKMAVSIVKGKEDCHPRETGISGILWMFTLGLFPMYESSYLEREIKVVTPLGEKIGRYRLDAKRWAGWIPMFVGYPASADMRAADADIKSISGMEMRQKVEAKLVDSLVRQFSYDEYLSYAKKRNDARQTELKRIAVAESNIVALIEKGDFDQAQEVCDKEFGGESEMKKLVAKKKADFTRQIAQKKEEERIAKRKEELGKLMAESKFIEVVTIAREEKLKSEESFGRPNFELWDGFETDATKAIEKQEIEKARSIVAELIRGKKFSEALGLCKKQKDNKSGSKYHNVKKVWNVVEKEILIAQASAAKENAKIKIDEAEKLFADKNYAQALKICESEYALSANDFSPDIANKWIDLRGRIVVQVAKEADYKLTGDWDEDCIFGGLMSAIDKKLAAKEAGKGKAPNMVASKDWLDSFCGISFGMKLGNAAKRTEDGKYLVQCVALKKPFRGITHANVYADITSRQIFKVQLEWDCGDGTDDKWKNRAGEISNICQALNSRYGTPDDKTIVPGPDKIKVDYEYKYVFWNQRKNVLPNGSVVLKWAEHDYIGDGYGVSGPGGLGREIYIVILEAVNDVFYKQAEMESNQESRGDGSGVL